jgi:hypothetical protein
LHRSALGELAPSELAVHDRPFAKDPQRVLTRLHALGEVNRCRTRKNAREYPPEFDTR